jgi:uncharacterized protein (TIGR00725 family)
MVKPIIGIIGAANTDAITLALAEEVGRLVAKKGAILVCGGLGGIMEAACRGAKSAGGRTVGILPQATKEMANQYVDVAIATGFGEGRNVIIARTADAVIAVAGEYGTLSELAYTLKMGKPVVGIKTWDIKGIVKAETPAAAVDTVFELLHKSTG